MRRKTVLTLTGLAMSAFVAGGANAQQFSDDFESYDNGEEVVGQNGWVGWWGCDGVSAAASTAFAHSGTKCLHGEPDDDTVQIINATSGVWTISVWTYVPASFLGSGYVIVMNEYAGTNCVGGTNDWSGQVNLNGATSMVVAESQGNGGTTAMLRDQWVEVLYVVDLDNNLHDVYYGSTQIVTQLPWDNDGTFAIAAIDLYAAPVGEYYFDDVNIDPVESETEVCATTATRVRGLPVSGTVADTCTSNDAYYITRPDVFRTVAIPPVQVRYDFTSPNTDPSEIRLRVESAANVNNIFERINIRNQDTSLYESVNTRVLTTTDGSIELVFSGANADKYVNDTTGAVDVLIQCNALAFSIAPTWQDRKDHVLLTVVN